MPGAQRLIKGGGCLLVAAVATVATAGPLLGQTSTATLTGVVQDSTGAALSAVEILATNVASGFEYGSPSTGTGRYWLAGLPPGDYDIVASRIGIETTRFEGITLPVGKTMTLDIRVAVAAVEIQGVRVEVTPRLMASTQADIAFSVNQDVIRRLPEESRQFIDLVGESLCEHPRACRKPCPTGRLAGR